MEQDSSIAHSRFGMTEFILTFLGIARKKVSSSQLEVKYSESTTCLLVAFLGHVFNFVPKFGSKAGL